MGRKSKRALFPDAEAACSFSDIMDLQGDYAMCRTHGRKCVVPSVDVFVCCTSCRDFCRWSGPNGLVLLQSSSTGGSAQTFAGFLKYLEKHRPSMVLFENVDSMEDKVAPNFSNLDLASAQLASRGYEHQNMISDAILFGLPQSRRRLFLAGVLTIGNPSITFQERSVDVTFTTLRSLIRCAQRRAACATELLLPPDHDAVED